MPIERWPRGRIFLIITATDAGSHLGHGVTPALVELGDRTLIARLLDEVRELPFSGIAVVCADEDREAIERAVATTALSRAARRESTRSGLSQASTLVRRLLSESRNRTADLDPGSDSPTELVFASVPRRSDAGTVPQKSPVGTVSRLDAIAAGLAALDEGTGRSSGADRETDIVLVHDAERALAPRKIFCEVIAGVCGGMDVAVPALEVTDSVKTRAPTSDGRTEIKNADRTTLRTLQTPRGFKRDALTTVLAQARGTDEGPTADVQAALAAGLAVATVHGTFAAFEIKRPVALWQAQITLGVERTAKSGSPASQRLRHEARGGTATREPR